MDYCVHFSAIRKIFKDAGREDLAELCESQLISVCEALPHLGVPPFDGMMGRYLADAYYNRGLSRLRLNRTLEARSDVVTSISFSEKSAAESRRDGMTRFHAEHTHVTARRLLAVIDLELGNPEAACATLDGILDDPTTTGSERAEALLVSAELKSRAGDLDGAMEALDAVLATNTTDLDSQRETARQTFARFLLSRSIRATKEGNGLAAVADLDRALAMVDETNSTWAAIRVNRSALHMNSRDFILAEQDCSAVISQPEAPPDQVIKALINRSQLRFSRRDADGANQDIEHALDLAGCNEQERARVLLIRAVMRWKMKDRDGATIDLNFVATAAENDEELREMVTILTTRYGLLR
jgi:hypothetical protein